MFFGKKKSTANSEIQSRDIFDDCPLNSLEDIEEVDAKTNYFSKYINNVEHLTNILKSTHLNLGSLVICVNAGWGVGKTSFINIVRSELEKKKLIKEHIWINYEPWHFSNSTELIHDFFSTLTNSINDECGTDVVPVSTVQEYIKLVTPIVEETNGSLGKVLSQFIDLIFKQKTLNDYKSDIKNSLRQLPFNVIVILDNLDRMEPEEIITSLKLVRLLSDFQNLTFLLSLDYERVSSLVAKHFSDDYRDYLQKIINTKITIESYSYRQLLRMFEYYFNYLPSESEVNNEQKRVILTAIFDSYILEMRAKQAREDFVRRKTTGDDIFLDPLYFDFRNLFGKFFPTDEFGELWNTTNSSRENKKHFIRDKIAEFYEKLGNNKYANISSAVEDAHDIVQLWNDNKFGNRWYTTDVLHNARPIGDMSNPLTKEIYGIWESIYSFYSRLYTDGQWRKYPNLYSIIKDRICTNIPFSSLKNYDGTKLKNFIRDVDENISFQWNSVNDKQKKDIEIIKDWMVKNYIKPRDIRQLANEFLSRGWREKTANEITLPWWGNILDGFTSDKQI